MPKCSFATVELKTYQVVPGSVGHAYVDIVKSTGKTRVVICTTHQSVEPVSLEDVARRGYRRDMVVLDCSTSDASKYHKVRS